MMRVYFVALCLVLRVSGQSFNYMLPAQSAVRPINRFPGYNSNQHMRIFNPQSLNFVPQTQSVAGQFRTFQHGNVPRFSPVLRQFSAFNPAGGTFLPNSQYTRSSHLQGFTSSGIPGVQSNSERLLTRLNARAVPPSSDNGGMWKLVIPAHMRQSFTSSSGSVGPSQSQSVFTVHGGGSGSTSESQPGAIMGAVGVDFRQEAGTDNEFVSNNGFTSKFIDQSDTSGGNGFVHQSAATGTSSTNGFTTTDYTSVAAIGQNPGMDIKTSEFRDVNSVTSRDSVTNESTRKSQYLKLKLERMRAARAAKKAEKKARKAAKLAAKLAAKKAAKLAAKKAAKLAAKKAAMAAAQKAKYASRAAAASAASAQRAGTNMHRGQTSFSQSSSTLSSNSMNSLKDKMKNGGYNTNLTPQVIANLMVLGRSYGLDDKAIRAIIDDLIKSMKDGKMEMRTDYFNTEQQAAFKELKEKSIQLLASIMADSQSPPSSLTSNSQHQQGSGTTNNINILLQRLAPQGNGGTGQFTFGTAGMHTQLLAILKQLELSGGTQGATSLHGTSGMNAEQVMALLKQIERSGFNNGEQASAQGNAELAALLKQLQMSQSGTNSFDAGSTLGAPGPNGDITSLLKQLEQSSTSHVSSSTQGGPDITSLLKQFEQSGTSHVSSSAQGSVGDNSGLAALLKQLQETGNGGGTDITSLLKQFEQSGTSHVSSSAQGSVGDNSGLAALLKQLQAAESGTGNGGGAAHAAWEQHALITALNNNGQQTGTSRHQAANAHQQQTSGSNTQQRGLGRGVNEHQQYTNGQITSTRRQQQSGINGHGSVKGSFAGSNGLADFLKQQQGSGTGNGAGLSQGSVRISSSTSSSHSGSGPSAGAGQDAELASFLAMIAKSGGQSSGAGALGIQGGSISGGNAAGQVGSTAGSSLSSETEIMKVFQKLTKSANGASDADLLSLIQKLSDLQTGGSQGSTRGGQSTSASSAFDRLSSLERGLKQNNGNKASSVFDRLTNQGSERGLKQINGHKGSTVKTVTSSITSTSGHSSPGSSRSMARTSSSKSNAGSSQGMGQSSFTSSSSSGKIYKSNSKEASGGRSMKSSSSRSSSSKSSGSSKSSKQSNNSSERKSSSNQRRAQKQAALLRKLNKHKRGQSSSTQKEEYILLYNNGQRKRVRRTDLERKLLPLVSQKSGGLSEAEKQNIVEDIVFKLRMESARRMQNSDSDTFHLALASSHFDGGRHIEFDHPALAGRHGVNVNQGFTGVSGGQSSVSNFEPSNLLISTLNTLIDHKDTSATAPGVHTTGSTTAEATSHTYKDPAGAANGVTETGTSRSSGSAGFLDSFFTIPQGQGGAPAYSTGGKMSAAEAFRIAAVSSLIGQNEPRTSSTTGPATNTNSGSRTATGSTTYIDNGSPISATVGSSQSPNSGSATSNRGGSSQQRTNSGSMFSRTSGSTGSTLDLSNLGAVAPKQQTATQTSSTNTHQITITNTGIETSHSAQGNGGIGTLDLSGQGPVRNIDAVSSNQASNVESNVATQNAQSAAGTRAANQATAQKAADLIDRIIANEMSHQNTIGGNNQNQGMSGSGRNQVSTNTDMMASVLADQVTAKHDVKQARNDMLASAITDMLTHNSAAPSNTHTSTSIQITSNGNAGSVPAVEQTYTTNTVSGANGGPTQNTLDHTNKMASVLADLIAVSPQHMQGAGSGGANTNSHSSSSVSMFSNTHSSGSGGHQMTGTGANHHMTGAGSSYNRAAEFGANPDMTGIGGLGMEPPSNMHNLRDFNMAISSAHGQAMQGANIPEPPSMTLLNVSNQPLDLKLLSGSSALSTGTHLASSVSGGAHSVAASTLPHTGNTLHQDMANRAFHSPMIMTSANTQQGLQPARAGLQNDMMIRIAELSGKLITSQAGHAEQTGSFINTADICVIPDCIRAATQIKASQDITASPCEDFYQYTCGGWHDTSRIRPDQHSRSIKWELMEQVDYKLHDLLNQSIQVQHTPAEQKAITFYKSCINEDAIETLGPAVIKPLIKDMGGWPMLDPNWTDRHYKLERMLSTARKYTIDTPIFSMSLESDPHFPEQHIIHIEQPHLGMKDRKYYLTDNKVYRAYATYMIEVAKALGADPMSVKQDVKDVIDFETQLANLTQEMNQNQDPTKDKRMTIDQLMQSFPGLDWKQYIYNIFSIDEVKISIHSSDLVLVSNPEYIRDVIGILRNTSARVEANYINWMMIPSLIISLPANIRQLHQTFTQTMSPGARIDTPRWQQCVDVTNKAFGLAVARLFVDRHFDAASKLEIQEIFNQTKSSMRTMLERESWMDQSTKTAALGKLNALQARVGYPDEIKNDAYLNKRYIRYTLTPGLFFQNTLNVTKAEAAANLRDMGMPTNVIEWEDPPPAAKDIFYDINHNTLVLPAGILQSPYFHKNYPRYLNYGAIGFIIGHKITHAFDDVGSKYGRTGQFQDWWSNYTRTAYDQKADCFIKQYDGLTVTDALTAATLPKDSKLNGELTLQENVADNGGMKESFTAYTQWAQQHGLEQKLPGLNLEPDQLFFVNYGRTWCGKTTPEEAIRRIKTDIFADTRNRINVVMQNNPNFAKAFSCPVGTPMNPGKKCAVW